MFAFLIPIIWFFIYIGVYLAWGTFKKDEGKNEDFSLFVCALIAFLLTFLTLRLISEK